MAETFAPIQQTEGVRETSIGNQQEVTKDSSYINAALQGVDIAVKGVDDVRGVLGKQASKDLASDVIATVDRERAEMEELATLQSLGDTASVADTVRKAKLLQKKVASGTMTRENARLRINALVTAGIEENPFLADKIRASAEGLLGFTLESEGAKQFFGSFEPAGSAKGPSAVELENQAISDSLGIPIDAVRRQRAATTFSQMQNDQLVSDLANTNMQADEFILEATSKTEESVGNILTAALATVRDSGALNTEQYAEIFAANEQAFVDTTVALLKDNGKYTLQAGNKAREQAKIMFAGIRENLGDLSDEKVTTRQLKLLTNVYTIAGMESFKAFSALRLGVGDNMANQVMELLISSRGNKSRLKTLMDSQPLVAQFVDYANMTDEAFAKNYSNTLNKFFGKNTTKDDMTQGEQAMVDTTLGANFKDLPEDESDSIIEKLEGMGFEDTKTASLIATKPPAAATKKQKAFMESFAGSARKAVPVEVAALIAGLPEGYEIIMTPNGLTQKAASVERRKGVFVSLGADPEVTKKLKKLNTYLNAAGAGWGKTFGVADKTVEGMAILNQINTEADKLRIKEEDRPVGRGANRPNPNAGNGFSAFGAPTATPVVEETRRQKLERLEALDAGTN